MDQASWRAPFGATPFSRVKVPKRATIQPDAAVMVESGVGIVLVSHDEDEHGNYLAEVLREQRHYVLRISYDEINRRPFAWEPGLLSAGLLSRDPQKIWAGFWRRAGTINVETIQAEYSDFATNEWRDAFEGALAAAPISWLSEIMAMRRAELKLVQLATARRIGVRYPPTLVTNDPGAASRFAGSVACVIKPVRYGMVSSEPLRMAWTRLVREGELSEMSGPPVILQHRVDIDYHLRVITVGQLAFPSKLFTGDLDWRVSLQNHEAFEPSHEARDRAIGQEAVRLATAMNIGFSAQDWVVSKAGEPYFLDLNPNGQWMFLEPAWSGAIGRAIGDALGAIAT